MNLPLEQPERKKASVPSHPSRNVLFFRATAVVSSGSTPNILRILVNTHPDTQPEYHIEPRLSRVCDMPSRSRPREIMDRVGAENVSDQVLLAILLRAGTRGFNVVDLAGHLMLHYQSLTALSQASIDDLVKIKGLGRVKAQILKAALELARRLAEEATAENPKISTPEEAARLLRERARTCEEEIFWILLLDARSRLKRPPVEVSRGLINASLVHPREVFKEAIRTSCAAVILAHNHPSGDPSPSPEDLRVTRQLVEAGKIIEIDVLDHVILGRRRDLDGTDYVSLRESGMVKFR